MGCGMSAQWLPLFLPPTPNHKDWFVALPVVHVDASERVQRKPSAGQRTSAPLRGNMCRNEKWRSLRIDGGHLGCSEARLAHSFA